MRRGIATTTLVTAGLAAAFAAPAAAQSAPAFTCEAFALRATVLGQAIEPVVYGRGQECRTGQATPTGALRALLPNGALPPELLSAELLSSTAGATCADGALALNGSSTITGVKLLGRPADRPRHAAAAGHQRPGLGEHHVPREREPRGRPGAGRAQRRLRDDRRASRREGPQDRRLPLHGGARQGALLGAPTFTLPRGVDLDRR